MKFKGWTVAGCTPDGENSYYSRNKTFMDTNYPPSKHWGPLHVFKRALRLYLKLVKAWLWPRLKALLGQCMTFSEKRFQNKEGVRVLDRLFNVIISTKSLFARRWDRSVKVLVKLNSCKFLVISSKCVHVWFQCMLMSLMIESHLRDSL